MLISISRDDLLMEIGNAAFVEADLREGTKDSHTLHQTYDICNEENRGRIDNLLDYAYSDACRVLRRVGRDVSGCGRKRGFRFETTLCKPEAPLLRAALREYLMATVMWGWLRTTLPEGAESWRQRREEAAGCLRECAGRKSGTYQRRVAPF